ncbi:MAG: hydroxymethylbilane synthase [Pseudomonadota bacterium]
MHKPIVIASRQSPLAVAQAKAVRRLLGDVEGIEPANLEAHFPLKTYVTSGDKNLQHTLADAGGKGLFVKEVEAALLSGEADIAVHSMKDMPAAMPPGLVLAAVPPREDPRDAFVTLKGQTLNDLHEGAVIGTSSVRRTAQLLRRRPDVSVVPFRGNVQTRLEKLARGEAEGTFLAEAGLQRLGRTEIKRDILAPTMMLPALGQGVLCVQARAGDERVLALSSAIICAQTWVASAVERAFLGRLDGSCRTPMAGLATVAGDQIHFRAEILSLDGQLTEQCDEQFAVGESAKIAQLGQSFAEHLLNRANPALRHALKRV